MRVRDVLPLWSCLLAIAPAVFVGCGQRGAVPAFPQAREMKRGKEPASRATVEVPGHGTEWPWPTPTAPELDRALAGLGPSETREIRLSMPADAAVLMIGDGAIHSGAAIFKTQTASIELLPDGRIRVMDAKGHTRVSGRQRMQRDRGPEGPGTGKELLQPTGLGLWLYPKLASQGTSEVRHMCEFGCVDSVADDHGDDIDYDTTKQAIPCEIVGSRCYATLHVTTTSDFKGSIGNWRVTRARK
jgi:hypothetical protein